MKKIALMMGLILSQLYGYSDADWDGVEDGFDRCPQTPLSDLVDMDGCTILKTEKTLHYSIIGGVGDSKINYASQEKADTTTVSFDVNVYMDRWQLQGSISRYSSSTENSKESGMDDSALNLFYRWALSEQLSITPGIGVVFPTYKTGYGNEATDYSAMVSVEYQFSPTLYGFGGYGYTWVNDQDTPTATYQNNTTFDTGLVYALKAGQEWNVHYNSNDTIYRDTKSARTIGIGFFSQLTPHWCVDGTYDYGLSDSAGDHSWNFRLGYYY